MSPQAIDQCIRLLCVATEASSKFAMDLIRQIDFRQLAVENQRVLGIVAIVVSFLSWLLFVPPKRLHSNFNSVPVIKSRFPGLGGVGFYANRYNLYGFDPLRMVTGLTLMQLVA